MFNFFNQFILFLIKNLKFKLNFLIKILLIIIRIFLIVKIYIKIIFLDLFSFKMQKKLV